MNPNAMVPCHIQDDCRKAARPGLTRIAIRLLLLPAAVTASSAPLTVVGDGRSRHVIVVAENAPDSVRLAAADLQHYIRKVSGAVLPLQNVASGGRSVISVGSTAAAERAGIDARECADDGFRIKTLDGSVYILGRDTPRGQVHPLGGQSRGTANGVYAFIENQLGVHWLAPGELGEEFTPRTSWTVPALDLRNQPAWEYRELSSTGSGPDHEAWQRRMRLVGFAAPESSHNWEKTIPPPLYDDHPDWFAEIDGRRVPPSGTYKLETTNPELVRAYARRAIEAFRADPNRRWYSLSPSDGGRWSESAASLAFVEGRDPNGNLSRTRLILKFYNEVAALVRQEFPDRRLGGYIYSSYQFPPDGGIPALEPNLSFVVAPGFNYSFQLFRSNIWDRFLMVMVPWGRAAQRDGFTVYHYNLPTVLVRDSQDANLQPLAPELIDFVYGTAHREGYRGGRISGAGIWATGGAVNYAMAKMMWDANRRAGPLIDEYLNLAYGADAARLLRRLFQRLNAQYRRFYIRKTGAKYVITSGHLQEIYGPLYGELDDIYHQALAACRSSRPRRRLERFGEVLSLMQWNLKLAGALPTTFSSPLTRTDEEIDDLVGRAGGDFSILAQAKTAPLEPPRLSVVAPRVSPRPPAASLAVTGHNLMLLQVVERGEVTVEVPVCTGSGEFAAFRLVDAGGHVLRAGAMRPGQAVRFTADPGTYFFHVSSRQSEYELRVTGARAALQADVYRTGLRFRTSLVAAGERKFAFHVPPRHGRFAVTLNARGVHARVFSPSNREVGQLDTREEGISRLAVEPDQAEEGIWRIVVAPTAAVQRAALAFDAPLPPWLSLDADHPLAITPAAGARAFR